MGYAQNNSTRYPLPLQKGPLAVAYRAIEGMHLLIPQNPRSFSLFWFVKYHRPTVFVYMLGFLNVEKERDHWSYTVVKKILHLYHSISLYSTKIFLMMKDDLPAMYVHKTYHMCIPSHFLHNNMFTCIVIPLAKVFFVMYNVKCNSTCSRSRNSYFV